MEDFFIAILLGVCLSCLESNDLPSFPRSYIHNRHVKYVTVYNQLRCNTTKNKHFILKKFFVCLMLCMNTSFYAIIYPFIDKMCLNVTYVTFYHLKLSHFSKVYVPSYSFHEGLGHNLMLIGLKYISVLISHICCVCSHLWVIIKHFLQGHYVLIAYTKHSFMKTQRPSLLS